MGIFDDSRRLFNRTFPWGMGRYRPEVYSDIESDTQPPDIDAISVYIDEEGKINLDNKMVSYETEDPIDVPVDHAYSEGNGFIDGLRKTLDLFPLYGVLLFPTIVPDSRKVVGKYFYGVLYTGGRNTRFPRDTPEGFVPCAGQLLTYPDGSKIAVPNLGSRTVTTGAGDGASSSVVTYAPPGTAYMMKVPPGYVEMVPDLNNRDLEDFGTASVGGLFF